MESSKRKKTAEAQQPKKDDLDKFIQYELENYDQFYQDEFCPKKKDNAENDNSKEDPSKEIDKPREYKSFNVCKKPLRINSATTQSKTTL